MQEEVEQKTMALSVRTARLTAELLQKAFRQFFEAQKNKPQEFKQGKQTLKELMKQNTNISSIEITHDNIKDFEGTAKKYGIDFALKKDISENPPRYLVFFKGRDADVMEAAFKTKIAEYDPECDELFIIQDKNLDLFPNTSKNTVSNNSRKL